MALIEVAGVGVLQGHISMPLQGVWSADLVLDTATVPAGAVDLVAADGLQLRGTVVRGGVDRDAASVWLVGGAGGLARSVVGAYQRALLRDPLSAILNAGNERLSTAVAADVLSLPLERWTLGRCRGSRALDELVAVASRLLEQEIHWRILGDGSVWLGAETWPTSTLPSHDDVVERRPAERRVVLGVEKLSLLPGVTLPDHGRVAAVEHWIEPEQVRTWAWLV